MGIPVPLHKSPMHIETLPKGFVYSLNAGAPAILR